MFDFRMKTVVLPWTIVCALCAILQTVFQLRIKLRLQHHITEAAAAAAATVAAAAAVVVEEEEEAEAVT